MQPMQWQKHTKCTSASLPNPTKATNATRGDDRKNKGGEHQISLRFRSNGFPHREERLIGRIVDLDLLFFKNKQESWEGWGNLQAQEGQQWKANTS
jgi:hypothetical protein